MNRYFKAEIAENIPLNKDYNLLTFVPSSAAQEPEPGQFYMIGKCAGEDGSRQRVYCKDIYDPLLKRPFSFLRRTALGFQILYRIKGKGTWLLKSLGRGSLVDVLGPLGNSYPMPDEKQLPVIVAGGIGIASLFFLAERLAELGNKADIYYGVRNENDLVLLDELGNYAKKLTISTDDGSCGEKGCITEIVKDFVSHNPSGYTLYSCGPRPMFEALSSIVKGKGMKTYISMEENMACGIGACLGCVVKTVNGHKRVCKEGPVFDINEVVW